MIDFCIKASNQFMEWASKLAQSKLKGLEKTKTNLEYLCVKTDTEIKEHKAKYDSLL